MLRLQLVVQLMAPGMLVRGECRPIEPIATKRIDRDVGGERRTQNAVVDAAAGRRFDEPCRVANGHHAVADGALDGAEGKDFLPRRRVFGADAQRAAHAIDHPPVAADRIAYRHNTDADMQTVRPRHWYRPGETP